MAPPPCASLAAGPSPACWRTPISIWAWWARPQVRCDANVLFWGGFGIFSGTEHPEAAWRFLKFYAGEEGAEVWQDWALPAVASVAESSGLADDPDRGRLAG